MLLGGWYEPMIENNALDKSSLQLTDFGEHKLSIHTVIHSLGIVRER